MSTPPPPPPSGAPGPRVVTGETTRPAGLSLPPQRPMTWQERAQAWAAAHVRRLWDLVIPSTLRWRLIGALLLAVVLAVTAETVSHMAEVSERLEHDLEAQGDRVSDALRSDLEQTVTALDFEIESSTSARGDIVRTLASGRVEARLLGTKSRLQDGVLEVLKALGPDGAILSSGHWPASFGALDPNFALYKAQSGKPELHIVDEPTPQGSAPALERWGVGRAGNREIIVVAGRFLDGNALERMRGRTGADVVALCRAEPVKVSRSIGQQRCIAVGSAEVLDEVLHGKPFDPDDDGVIDRFHLVPLNLGTHHLWVGLDRSSILSVRAAILRRAFAVALASIAFAMLLGTLLATRLTRPIEQLAQAAGKLASGDLSARVDPAAVAVKQDGKGEVDRLVVAFNGMAADLEKNQTKLLQTERVSAWQEIARGLAHELKNPLTPILGAMDVVRKARKLDRPDFDAILEEQATAVVEEVMRLKELSDAFARFARLPDRKPEPLLMNELIDHAAALYVKDEAVAIEREYDPDVPEVVADRTQIATVLTNLVKNAVEAMTTAADADGAGRDKRLGLILRRVDDAHVELVVEDSGPGIAPEIAERLFTPYVTTKGSRGTGLGLALAHRIVAEHGGTIEAGRATRGGAAFCVRLPINGPGAPPPLRPA